jgi:hypothetical protein
MKAATLSTMKEVFRLIETSSIACEAAGTPCGESIPLAKQEMATAYSRPESFSLAVVTSTLPTLFIAKSRSGCDMTWPNSKTASK